MNREEAIDILRHLYSRCNWETTTCDFYGCDKCEDALNMAIESISADIPINGKVRYKLKKPIQYVTLEVEDNCVTHTGNDVIDSLNDTIKSADRPTLKQTDTLIIADALRYLAQDTERHLSDRTRADALREQILEYGASICKPSADRPQGEWYQIKDHKIMGEGYLWHCSICDYKVYQDSSKDYPTENYCPNCGADMRGEST